MYATDVDGRQAAGTGRSQSEGEGGSSQEDPVREKWESGKAEPRPVSGEDRQCDPGAHHNRGRAPPQCRRNEQRGDQADDHDGQLVPPK